MTTPLSPPSIPDEAVQAAWETLPRAPKCVEYPEAELLVYQTINSYAGARAFIAAALPILLGAHAKAAAGEESCVGYSMTEAWNLQLQAKIQRLEKELAALRRVAKDMEYIAVMPVTGSYNEDVESIPLLVSKRAKASIADPLVKAMLEKG